MSRIFITGSTDGLGLAAARLLLDLGHEVILHARTVSRADDVADIAASTVVVGDLSRPEEIHSVAAQVNELGRMDTVIHNAGVGIYLEETRGETTEGRAKTMAVNTLAPYMLTGLLERPKRLIYLSSRMHEGAGDQIDDIDWKLRKWDPAEAYCESKLYVTTLAAAVARLWPDVLSNSVDPGWVPTKMGGPDAPDDLQLAHLTQTWLAVSDDSEAVVSGRYWYHQRERRPSPLVADHSYQDKLISKLASLTGVILPQP